VAALTPATLELGAPAVDLLAIHRRDPARYPFLLESAARDGASARWDLLFGEPGERLVLDAAGAVRGPHAARSFLGSLDAWAAAERAAPVGGDLPFGGGWFLYLGYELAEEIEPTLRLPRDRRLPVAVATRCRAALLRDRASGRLVAVAEQGAEALQRIAADVAAAGMSAGVARPVVGGFVEEPPQPYLDAVARARRYIHDGDVFQANLSRGWHGALAAGVGAADLYQGLRESNPAPFAGLAVFDGFAVASSSPERLVEVRGRRVETRPIAGTRRRDPDRARDAALVAELIAHPKERAEHVMLIDLERNDLSRVCEPGSVRVSEMMGVESYATVHHIVSNVVGRLRADATPGAVVRAAFPGGTITGCPKVRCMEVIAELEGVARGPYTGSMGYLDRGGDLDLNILIRTALVIDGAVELRAGAGIVDESVPERELEETRHKARGLLRAFGAEAA
jgi:anthranilate synthase component 1